MKIQNAKLGMSFRFIGDSTILIFAFGQGLPGLEGVAVLGYNFGYG